VLSIENNLPIDTQQWLNPQHLTEIVDEHVSYVGLASTRASYIGQQQTTYGQGRYQSHRQNEFDGVESGGVSSHKFDRHKPQQQGQSQGKTSLDGGALFVSPRRIISQNVTSLKTKGSGRLSMSLRPVSNPSFTGTQLLSVSTSQRPRSTTGQPRTARRLRWAIRTCLCVKLRLTATAA